VTRSRRWFARATLAAVGGVVAAVELALGLDLVGVVKAINMNVTATGTQGDGYMTVYSCSQGAPNASNLNYRQGDTVAASAFGSFDAAGEVCIKTSAISHIIIDSVGVFG